MPVGVRDMLRRVWHSPTLTTWGSLSIRLIGFGILLPLALKKLPAEEASVWFLFSAVTSLLVLADFGFAPTFIRTVAYAHAQDQQPSANIARQDRRGTPCHSLPTVLSTMRQVYNYVGLIALVFGGFLGSLAVAAPIGHVSSQSAGWTAWVIVLLGTAVNLRFGMYAIYLQALERIPEFRRWEIISGLFFTSASIAVLLAGGTLLALVLVTQAGFLVTALVNWRLATRATSNHHWLSGAKWSSSVWNMVWPAAWKSGLGVLMTFGAIQGSGVVYAQFAPPRDVAAYLLAQRMMQTLINLANVPFYTKIPSLSRLFSNRRITEMLKIAHIGMLQANWIFVLGVLILGYGAEHILRQVESNTSFLDSKIWWIMALAFVTERTGAMYLQLYTTTNHVVWHIANGIAGLIMILLMPILFHYFGVIGLPVATFLGYALFYAPYGYLKCQNAFNKRITPMEFSATALPVTLILIIAGSQIVLDR